MIFIWAVCDHVVQFYEQDSKHGIGTAPKLTPKHLSDHNVITMHMRITALRPLWQ